jgi:hypothetical protein
MRLTYLLNLHHITKFLVDLILDLTDSINDLFNHVLLCANYYFEEKLEIRLFFEAFVHQINWTLISDVR